uniref:Site-2 protease family protein n=1 Tax=Acidobacterium capsulatum TaxID=33075 RepID=A0A7V4XRT2_9BACT
MNQQIVIKIFEFVLLLFALSLHEASHAWMASRLGDQTARMLGRVTLNPVKHIDILGTIILPLVMLFAPGFGQFLIGWAKPTPVNGRNFKHYKRDDMLVTLAGPGSNLVIALVSVVLVVVLAKAAPGGELVVHALAAGAWGLALAQGGAVVPVGLLLYLSVWLNLMLTIFNLLPIPPLDGSHILRSVLPYNALKFYDSLGGWIGLALIIFVGAPVMDFFLSPLLAMVNMILLRV